MLHGVEIARMMWTLYEAVHAVTYFAPEARERFTAAGLRGFWRGYFAGRTAPLGPVGAAPVVATYYNFAPAMVARAVPAVWDLATPEQALVARSEGAAAALERLTAGTPAAAVAEAADLLTEVTGRLEYGGRVLGAANAALPVPGEPLARLWQAATTLREHRGDGHVAALVAAGIDGCQILAWRAAHDLTRDTLQPHRGWTDEEWDAATARLRERGWLDGNGRPTVAGLGGFQEIEATTDRICARAWTAVDTDRLRHLLAPLARACHASIPSVNAIGLAAPDQRPASSGRT
jgi:hypothetical protein